MSVEPHESQVPANLSDLETGLEDFEVTDVVVPRISFLHKEGLFEDSLSGQTFPKLKAVILGLVKQRVLWHHTVGGEGNRPMCKSPDHVNGFPNMRDDQPKDKRFPWEKSGFREEDQTPNEEGFLQLPCASCALKDWGSHPDGRKPYCGEQWTLPIMYDPHDNGSLIPAILTCQKTSIKPVKTYLTSFQRSQTPPYTVFTEIGLQRAQMGTTDYSIATFRQAGETPQDQWREFSTSLVNLRSFLRQHPQRRDDDGEPTSPSDNTNAAPPQAQPQASAPAKEPVPAETPSQPQQGVATSETEDDLPF